MTALRSVCAASSFVCVLTLVFGCAKEGQQPLTSQPAAQADHRAVDEAAIRSLDSSWVKAVGAKNPEQSASYYASDGVLMAPGGPMTTGKDAIQKGWAGMMALPGFALTFAPDKVTVAGDLAYEIGEYEMTTNDKAGKPHAAKGKYIVVWGRQPDGSWKALVDAPTTTQ